MFDLRGEIDSIAAAIELARRGRALLNNDRSHIVFPEWNGTVVMSQWKKELPAYKGSDFHSWKEFYEVIKKLELSYRLLYSDWLKSHKDKVSRMGSYKSMMTFSCL